MSDVGRDDLLSIQLKAIRAAESPGASNLPISATLSRLAQHGGLYQLLDEAALQARVAPLIEGARQQLIRGASETEGSAAFFTTSTAIPAMAKFVSRKIANFFSHLAGPACPIPSGLMSHLTMPGEGKVFTSPQAERSNPGAFDSKEVPAAFTFVGQFIDHDLTLNALNLFENQTGAVVDSATPLIDLDSVYGPREVLADSASFPEVIDPDGRFLLRHSSDGVIDVLREPPAKGTSTESAKIFDGRNDENQMILQVHILVMRLHNALVTKYGSFDVAKTMTILNWQAFVINDYLRKIIRQDVLDYILDEVVKPNFGNLKHKPLLDLATNTLIGTMPHEFAIGFRMGHSQLRPAYEVQSGVSVRLFNNRQVGHLDPDGIRFDDLRGGQKLRAGHQIDWSFFLKNQLANGIDSHVTSVAFDLPESAIPDEIKFVSNLPHRNLIRSVKVGLCSGEALAEFYDIKASERLAPATIEPDQTAHALFETSGPFFTPLWFYLLKEAEHEAGGAAVQTLGALGSHLVGEVIVGGIAFNPDEINYFKQADPKVWSITGETEVSLQDIVDFVAADKGP